MAKAKKELGRGAQMLAALKSAGEPKKGERRVLLTKSVPESFWRGGVKHTKAGGEFSLDNFNDDQLIAIFDEPNVVAEVKDLPAEGEVKE